MQCFFHAKIIHYLRINNLKASISKFTNNYEELDLRIIQFKYRECIKKRENCHYGVNIRVSNHGQYFPFLSYLPLSRRWKREIQNLDFF